jgi:hypothetical protein
MPHIIIETARSFPGSESFFMLGAPDEEPLPFPCTITMPFAVVAVTTGVVVRLLLLLLGGVVTVLVTLVRLSVLMVEVPEAPPLIVPVQLVPAQQQATCPAQS